ncbi:Crp/Fnr family transcriptional regulator [Chloroflexota bacterium]
MQTTQVLKNTPIFSGLDEVELASLSHIALERSFDVDEFVFWEDGAPEWFYVIVDGRIKVIKHSTSGKDLIVAFFNPGEVFGEVAVFENKPYPASAQVVEKVSLLGFRRDNFLRFLMEHPQVALKIINMLSGRLREAQGRIRDLAGERVQQRLARILLMLSAKLGNTLPFTREEVADMSGMTTETVIRQMANFKDRVIVSSTRGEIIIVDEVKLKLLAEGPPQV